MATPPSDDLPLEFVTPDDAAGSRLDQYLASQLEASRSIVQDWIKNGLVLLGGRPAKASTKLKAGQCLQVHRPPLIAAEPLPDASIPLEVLFEDEHLLVLNKQRGLVVHPAVGNPDKTLVNALLAHCSDWSGIGGVSRPGIVHRLDKETSGVMVVAKHDQAHQHLSEQFSARTVMKLYHALVWGVPSPRRGRINQPIARHPQDRLRMACIATGKPAITDYEVTEVLTDRNASVELRLHTGRTHQIRVHLTWLGFPIVGDPVYGRKGESFGLQGQALHSHRLELDHPTDGRRLEFVAPWPDDMRAAREQIL